MRIVFPTGACSWIKGWKGLWPLSPRRYNFDLVFHRADAGRSPRCFFRLVLLCPGPHLPLRLALLLCTSTVIDVASISALRNSACSIFFFNSDGVAFGVTAMRLLAPFTRERRRTTRSASCLWYCHSTSSEIFHASTTASDQAVSERQADHDDLQLEPSAMLS
jgi:hypothetical protein